MTGRQAIAAARRWIGGWPGWARWLAVVGWMGLIFGVSAQPDLPRPTSGTLDWLLSVAGHVAEYAVLGGLLAWTLRRGRTWKSMGLAVLYALSDELHQAFVPGRMADPLDLVIDVLGATMGIGLVNWLLARRRR